MKKEVYNGLKWTAFIAFSLGLSGCASLKGGPLKAPCGQIAGQTDPCGNRIDINTIDTIETITSEYKAIT